MKRSAKELVAEANAAVRTLSAEEAAGLVGEAGVLFVDVREPAEIVAGGLVAGALPVPRGVLEFQADPESALHRPEFSQARRLVLYCASGGRSALAAKSLQDMGFETVAHVAGGFTALKAAGAPIAG